MPYRLIAGLCTAAVSLASAASASAFDCTVANKPATAGATGVVDVRNDSFTPLKPNPGTFDRPHGAFIVFTDGENSASTFVHAPDGVLPPVREGGPQHNCDGKGLDSLDACGLGG